MIPCSDITDHDRMNFLMKMVADSRSENPLLVSSFERGFIWSFSATGRETLFFTEKRRVVVDKMRMKYGSERGIDMPFPLPKSGAPKTPEADANCCMFLVREDGRQRPCNAPAAFVRQNGFRYCDEHKEALERDMKRQGKTLIFNPFKP